jgi:O-antigen/teichoic acid export membrane protein
VQKTFFTIIYDFSLRLVPSRILLKIKNQQGLQKVIENLIWLIFDKVLRMGGGVIIGVWIARYLGPEQFGLLNFALAFVGLFASISTLGLQEIIVRDLINRPKEDIGEILGTGFFMRLLGGLFSFVIAILLIHYLRPDDILSRIIISILGFTLIFKSTEVVKYWFESKVESKYVVWIENGIFLGATIFKIIAIVLKASILIFIMIAFVESLIVAILLMYLYQRNSENIKKWSISRSRLTYFFRDAWPLFLSGLAISLYMKIDQIMLGQMMDNKTVGIYSAAVRISEIWYFIPVTIVASVFPSVLNSKKNNNQLYIKSLQRLYDIMVWISLIIAFLVSIFGDKLISLIFGNQYSEASDVLKIHIWAGINVAIGTVWGKWILIENKQKIALYGYVLGALINIILNFFLIDPYGAYGAAFATFISYWISALFAFSLYQPKITISFLANSINPLRIINELKSI